MWYCSALVYAGRWCLSIEHFGRVDWPIPSAVRPPALCGIAVALGTATSPQLERQPAIRPRVAMIPKEPSDATRASGFPQFPGEEVYSHAAAQFQEKAEARLASLGLLAAAEGMPSELTVVIRNVPKFTAAEYIDRHAIWLVLVARGRRRHAQRRCAKRHENGTVRHEVSGPIYLPGSPMCV